MCICVCLIHDMTLRRHEALEKRFIKGERRERESLAIEASGNGEVEKLRGICINWS